MGANTSSHLEKELSAENFAGHDRFYGLVNFGNTCYCNSVLQALYFCQPFRERVLAYRQQQKKLGNQKDNLLICLADLFSSITNQKRRVGTIAPKRFVAKLKKDNELFDNFMQQDAHEFLNFLINALSETLAEERRTQQTNGTTRSTSAISSKKSASQASESAKILETRADITWVQDLFQGTLTNETRCLNCETVSSKDESFLDLSVDVEHNVSITHCLRSFSNMETLCGDQKYYCENCCAKQEAQKRMRIKRLPKLLALHLKRFKYMEHLNRYTKLSYRVQFPLELRLSNLREDAAVNDKLYDLVAVVVHSGISPHRGHYITLVKSQNFWLLFDDDIVDKIEESALEDFFGLSDCNAQKNSESAYILFYQTRE